MAVPPSSVVAKAYAVIPSDEETDQQHGMAVLEHVTVELDDLHRPLYSVSAAYTHLPEAQGLTWTDDFFDDEPDEDIVAVFDLDYDLMETYYEKVGWTTLGVLMFFPNLLWIGLLGMAPCYLRRNVQWSIRSQHVAVTRDGIRYVKDRRPTCWGMACTDAGKFSKTVPFDKITDCDVVEPAGNTCCWIPNTLYTVNVDTASSEKAQHELSISGLKNPLGFKRLVWAMKRAYHPVVARLPSAMEIVTQGLENAKGQDVSTHQDDVATLLREIRDELRQNNEALRSMNPPSTETTATQVEAEVV